MLDAWFGGLLDRLEWERKWWRREEGGDLVFGVSCVSRYNWDVLFHFCFHCMLRKV